MLTMHEHFLSHGHLIPITTARVSIVAILFLLWNNSGSVTHLHCPSPWHMVVLTENLCDGEKPLRITGQHQEKIKVIEKQKGIFDILSYEPSTRLGNKHTLVSGRNSYRLRLHKDKATHPGQWSEDNSGGNERTVIDADKAGRATTIHSSKKEME